MTDKMIALEVLIDDPELGEVTGEEADELIEAMNERMGEQE